MGSPWHPTGLVAGSWRGVQTPRGPPVVVSPVNPAASGCGGAGMSGMKSYSSTKGFGLMLHPDQARNLRPAGTVGFLNGVRPAGATMPLPTARPTMNAGVFVAGKGLVNMGNFVCGGKLGGGLLLGKGLVGATGLVGGLAGSAAAAQQTPNRRAWSPHAGSRAIRKCYKGSDDEVAKSPSPSSKSSSSGRSSISSRSSKRSRKRKKGKKKRSKSGSRSRSRSRSSRSSSSSSSRRSRSRSRRRKTLSGMKDALNAPKESKEIEEAKMDALQKLTKLQSVEPKEARAKEWRLLLRTWHPDKNPEKLEVATAVFQFLQKGKSLLNLEK